MVRRGVDLTYQRDSGCVAHVVEIASRSGRRMVLTKFCWNGGAGGSRLSFAQRDLVMGFQSIAMARIPQMSWPPLLFIPVIGDRTPANASLESPADLRHVPGYSVDAR